MHHHCTPPHKCKRLGQRSLSWILDQNRRGVRLTTWEEQCTAPYMDVMGLHRGRLQDSGCFSTLFRRCIGLCIGVGWRVHGWVC